MVLTFPSHFFGFNDTEFDIERSTLKGGTALSGEQDIVSTDGGGRVYAEFSNGPLVDRNPTLAWRALLTQLEEGVTQVVVPLCDARHTPYSAGVGSSVPHSDGTPFSDDSEYVAGGPTANAAGAALLRATQLTLNLALEQPLLGGEWFAIEHPTKGWRAYNIGAILAQTTTTATVSFRPPLREAVPAGKAVELRAPRCLMVQDGKASRKKSGRYTEAAIRFIEAP